MKKKAVCIMSGGLDSVVATYVAKDEGYEIYTLFFDYGQKALTKERESFERFVSELKCKESKQISIPLWKEIGGTYLLSTAPEITPENESLEYVPFRNAMFISYGVAWAEALNAQAIFFGSTLGAVNCPDNTPQFFNALQNVINFGTKKGSSIKIELPLLKLTKTEVVELGQKLGVNMELTWSCLYSDVQPCHICSNCRMREKAFKEANIKNQNIAI